MTAATDRRAFDGHRVFRLHAILRRELARNIELTRAVADDDGAAAELVADRLRLVDNAVYRHNCAEDAVLWPRLVGDRPSEADIMVDVMHKQHRALDAMSLGVQATVLAWEDEPTRHRREMLIDALERFDRAHGEHVCATELFVVPLLERHLSTADWVDVLRGGIENCDRDTIASLSAVLRLT
jgi:hemerythrin-like domain-containing protein